MRGQLLQQEWLGCIAAHSDPSARRYRRLGRRGAVITRPNRLEGCLQFNRASLCVSTFPPGGKVVGCPASKELRVPRVPDRKSAADARSGMSFARQARHMPAGTIYAGAAHIQHAFDHHSQQRSRRPLGEASRGQSRGAIRPSVSSRSCLPPLLRRRTSNASYRRPVTVRDS